MYRLIFLSGKMKGRRLAVRQGSILIGCDPACHVELAGDPAIAPRHATIEERDNTHFLCGTDAANLLQVNGRPVVETTLKHGDKIDIGQTQIEFQIVHDSTPIGTKRRISTLQIATLAIVGAIVLAEVFFVVIVPMMQEKPEFDPVALAEARKKALAKKAAANAPVVIASDTNNPDMLEARARINEIAALSNDAPVAVFTSPVPEAVVAPQVPPPTPEPVVPVVVAKPTNDVPLYTALAATSTAPHVEAASSSVAEDAVIAEARRMVRDALSCAATGGYERADRTLDRVQFMAPDFLPAYLERAKLLEQRGLYRAAAGQWKEVEARTAGTPRAAEAKAEQARMARLELAARDAPPKQQPPADTQSSKHVRILSIEREKFQSSRDYEEMRVLRINIRPHDGEAIDPEDVRVMVHFFDRNADNDKVALSRALAPERALRIDGRWPAGETKSVTATYVVPQNFRNEELRVQGERCVYHGYRVQLFHKGRLVDEDASPNDLLTAPLTKPVMRMPADLPIAR